MRSAYTVARGAADRVAALTIRTLDRLLPSPRPFVVRLWDGSVLSADSQSRFDLVLTHPGALRRMLLPPGDLTLGEAFLRGDFEIEGDLEAAVGTIAAAATRARLNWLTVSLRTLGLPKTSGPFPVPRRARLSGRLHSLGRDRAAIAHHYRGFDKIVSVGMFEHVGEARLSEYFGRAFALLRPGGLFLNHGIAGRPNPPLWRRLGRRASFLNAHVFPDGDLVPLGNVTAVAERCGFEVRDVESLREHYVRTLRLWVQRLQARRDQAVQLVGGGKYRTWRLFMAASAGGFAAARTSVFQALLAKPDDAGHAGLPWSRADLYA